MKKGTMSYDFVIAIIMFLTVYVTMIQTSLYPMADVKMTEDIYKGEINLMTETTVKTPGEPSNWTEMDQVERFGLALSKEGNNPNILDLKKLEELDETNCSVVREKTPIDTGMNISFTVNNKTYSCNRWK